MMNEALGRKSGERKRVLVVGLDGAAWEILRPMADEGRLPCLAALMRCSACCELRSTAPPLTPPAWSSFATGVAPEEHGVFGFNYPDPHDYSLRLTSAADLLRPTLWQHLSSAGLRVLLLDVPFTFPPQSVHGFMVSGFPTPAAGCFTHPSDLANRFDCDGFACERHPAEPPDPASAGFLAWLDRFLDARLALFRKLSAAAPWDFAMVGTMALDWAQHALWKYYDPRFVFASEPEAAGHRETLREVYRRVDRWIGDLIGSASGEPNVVVLSDHGFGTTYHHDWICEALTQAGLLHWRSGAGAVRRLSRRMLQIARSSPHLQRWGKRLLGETRRARTWARTARAYDAIDWERTRVFPAGDYHLNLYVHTKARFARGMVGAGRDYARVLEDAKNAVLEFCPPGHRLKLARSVSCPAWPAEERAIRLRPDLIVELSVFPPSAAASVGQMAGLCGFHVPSGVLISPLEQPARADICGVARTILDYFGVPPAAGSQSTPPGRPEFSAAETAAMLDSLRRLGYMD
ncbi:MAG: alkaline phosphatase family protein [Candidatus Sumerlaeia bacterium]|nr:alkaline phosphatase family protein [Candidatus Sumerlaeia bacterium]